MSAQPPRRVEWDPSKLHFEFPRPDKLERFRELQIYIAHQSIDDPTFSMVKMYKILFYSDFEVYGRYGEPITGWSYRKLPFGPAPTSLSRVQAEMVKEGLIRIVERQVHDYSRQRILPLREPDYDLFKSHEIAVVEYWIRFFWAKSAKWVSQYSHGKAWKLAREGDLIPYEAVFISDDPINEDDIARAKELAARYGWKL
jgi:hypothetical protein